MRDLGQFVAGPASILDAPSPWLAVGVFLLCITLALSVVLLLQPLARNVRSTQVITFIPFVGLGAVLLVLISQWGAEWIRTEEGLRAARSTAFTGGQQLLGRMIFFSLAYLVGWGYSRSFQPDTLEEHILSSTVGAGVLEELVKACIGVLFGAYLFNPYSGWEKSARRLALAFTAAGISFGAGEALFYFQVYSSTEASPVAYMLRAVWCVLLHGAWSLLTALFLYAFRFRMSPGAPRSWFGAKTALFIACCLPAALLHGIYVACCLHTVAGAVVAGGLCLSAGLCVLLFLREPLYLVSLRAKAELTPKRECCLVCVCGHEIGLEVSQAGARVGCQQCGKWHSAPKVLAQGGRYSSAQES